MQLKLELEGPAANLPNTARRSVTVETHVKRGDTWVVGMTEVLLQGSTLSFNPPEGAKLVLSFPDKMAEVVFDPIQGAAIRPAAQANGEGRADKATERVQTPPPAPTPATPQSAALTPTHTLSIPISRIPRPQPTTSRPPTPKP